MEEELAEDAEMQWEKRLAFIYEGRNLFFSCESFLLLSSGLWTRDLVNLLL